MNLCDLENSLFGTLGSEYFKQWDLISIKSHIFLYSSSSLTPLLHLIVLFSSCVCELVLCWLSTQWAFSLLSSLAISDCLHQAVFRSHSFIEVIQFPMYRDLSGAYEFSRYLAASGISWCDTLTCLKANFSFSLKVVPFPAALFLKWWNRCPLLFFPLLPHLYLPQLFSQMVTICPCVSFSDCLQCYPTSSLQDGLGQVTLFIPLSVRPPAWCFSHSGQAVNANLGQWANKQIHMLPVLSLCLWAKLFMPPWIFPLFHILDLWVLLHPSRIQAPWGWDLSPFCSVIYHKGLEWCLACTWAFPRWQKWF